jgi:hypothetical protein
MNGTDTSADLETDYYARRKRRTTLAIVAFLVLLVVVGALHVTGVVGG